MAKLSILEFPDSRLRKKASPVERVDDEIRKLLDDMLETMYAAPGVGLAATQVNVHKRVIVIDLSEEKNDPLFLINPQIVEKSGNQEFDEGCLSVPGIFEKVHRADKLRFAALDRNGDAFEMEVEGLLAVCVQHELDHLEGKVFVDYLSTLKRHLIRKRLEKEKRQKSAQPDSKSKASLAI